MEKQNNKSKPCIAYVVLDIYPCATGGLETFYANHLSEMTSHVELYLITTCKTFSMNECNIIVVPRRFLGVRGTGRLAKLFFTAWQLVKIRKQINYVHLPYTSNAGNWGYIFPLLKIVFGLKYLLYIHGGGMRKWKKWMPDRWLFRDAYRIAGVSEIIKNEYEKRCKRSVEVVYPLTQFKVSEKPKMEIRKMMGLPEDDRIILYVGSLKPLKNPDILLSAFIALGRDYLENNHLKLMLVGDGIMRAELELLVKQHDMQSFVIFAGKIPNEKICNYYKMADYYVIPSKFEGTPISMIEAMFNKLPIVGANVSGIQNILGQGQNGLLFDPGNIVHLKVQLLFLLENPKEAELMAENAKAFFDLIFNKDFSSKKLLQIFKF